MMGYIAHNAIVVTGSGTHIKECARKARQLGLPVTTIGKEVVNGYRSFLICADGSKEGWNASNEGDERRAAWKAWLRESAWCAEWCEVRYGYDDGRADIVDDGFRGRR